MVKEWSFENIGCPHGKKLILDSYFISITNIYSIWTVDLNVKDKSIKLLNKNIDYLCGLLVVNNFFLAFLFQ